MGRMSREIRDTSGTRPYMAPEQWLGGKQGPATDQYALAVLFHELLTGEVPFSAVFDTGDPVVMMNVVGREPFAPPDGLAKPVRLALAKALAKKPEERFASCSEFVDALEGRVKVSRRGAETRSGGSGTRKALGLLALLAALGAGGYYGWTKYDTHVRVQNAEAVRFRQKVYELKGKASQAREKNAKEEWHDWPHFSQRAKELEGAFRAGESAFEKDDYEVAEVQFLKVRSDWYWLSSNKFVRTEAVDARRRADASRLAAESARALELAEEAYSAASNSLARAGQAFEAGEFRMAAEEFGAAEKAFDNAAAQAKDEGGRRAAERKRADTEAALVAFRLKPPRYEDGFLLAQTADHDNPDIQFYLGVCYSFGYGVAKDEAEAVKWYRKSAEQGDASAQYNLGVKYDNGRGVAKDEAEAVKWYRKAAEQGYADAQLNLGAMYYNGRGGLTEDKAKAAEWYKKAADQGEAIAQSNLGIMYEYGQGGLPKDEAEAVKWYRKAAEQGHASAQYNLGVMYEKGRGVEKNLKEAKAWHEKAAAQGYAKAKDALKSLSSCSLNDFFPVARVTLGETRHSQIVALGGKAEGEFAKQCVHYVDLSWWDHNEDGIVEGIYTVCSQKMPPEWTAKGLSWELSYDGWLAFFQDNGFSIKIDTPPKVVPYYNDSTRKTLQAGFVATASDGSIKFELGFNYGNCNGEGYSTSSRNSLYSISVKALKPLASR